MDGDEARRPALTCDAEFCKHNEGCHCTNIFVYLHVKTVKDNQPVLECNDFEWKE